MNQDFIQKVLKSVRDNQSKLSYNHKIYRILEGDLLSYIVESMANQMKPESLRIAQERIPPINILKKIISKLSTLYVDSVTRILEQPSEQDKQLIDYYEKQGVNKYFQLANENFNSCKTGLIEMYEDQEEREIKFRTLAPHQYVAYNDDVQDPTKVTAIVKIMSDKKLWIYTETEFASVNDVGEYILEDMRDNEGVNPFGVIPFEYINKSKYTVVPEIDSDVVRMCTLFPILLSDINTASQFLSQPLLYTVDVNAESLPVSPGTFWNLKSDMDGKTPSVGVVKPEPNIEGQLMLAVNELKLWLESLDIRPGSGQASLTVENAASGISLVIQEMDTTNNRKKQTVYFKDAEQGFWDKLSKIHNALAMAGRLEERGMFSPDINVNVRYSEMKPIEDRGALVNRLKVEHESGFIPKKYAIKQLYPDMSDEEIDEWISEISEEGSLWQNGKSSRSDSADAIQMMKREQSQMRSANESENEQNED